jgi:hypothetical protein
MSREAATAAMTATVEETPQPAETPAPARKPVFNDAPSSEATPKEKLAFTKSFVFDYDSEEDDCRYLGTFTCRRLTLGLLGQFGVYKAKLNGGERVDPYIDQLHEMVAYLSFALTSTPDWWEPEGSYDPVLVRSIYEYVRSWENSFRKKRAGQ